MMNDKELDAFLKKKYPSAYKKYEQKQKERRGVAWFKFYPWNNSNDYGFNILLLCLVDGC